VPRTLPDKYNNFAAHPRFYSDLGFAQQWQIAIAPCKNQKMVG